LIVWKKVIIEFSMKSLHNLFDRTDHRLVIAFCKIKLGIAEVIDHVAGLVLIERLEVIF
jgi:hypothetical protein